MLPSQIIIVTRWVLPVKQDFFSSYQNTRVHSRFLSEVRVVQSLRLLCTVFVDHCFSVCPVSFGHSKESIIHINFTHKISYKLKSSKMYSTNVNIVQIFKKDRKETNNQKQQKKRKKKSKKQTKQTNQNESDSVYVLQCLL